MTDISDNLARIRTKISQIAADCDRSASDIQLLAVSKGQPLDRILAAAHANQQHFGENYLQDALPKIKASHELGYQLVWHYIGQIQSNKTRHIAENFSWCHSLSSLKHAQRLETHRSKTALSKLNICIQVQFELNQSRGGIQFSDVETLINDLTELEHLHLRGIMCVLPEQWQNQEIDDGYKYLHEFFRKLQSDYPQLDTLSCGMSADYAQAIQHGSTLVRLGTAIFGQRE